jgi:hypothetical protein
MGFDLRSADQTLLIDKDGRIRYEAAFGFYDPDLTATRLEACDECIQPEAIDYHEVKYYSWGEDFTPNLRRRFEPPMFDSIGRGGRVAVGDGYALRTHHTQGMEDMIGAMNGDLPSLANSDDYELAARALVGMNAYAAGFRSHGLSLEEFQMDCQCDTDEISLEERVNSATSTPLMEHFTVAAAGYAFDDPDDSAYSVIALVHNDEASAQTNAERFEERLRVEYPAIENIFPTPNWGGALERVEIAVDGRVLLARLYREPATSGATHIHAPSILRRGGPLMHD